MKVAQSLYQFVLLSLAVSLVWPAFATAQDARSSRVPDLRGKRPTLARQLARLSELEYVPGVFYIASDAWRGDFLPERIQLQSPQSGTPIAAGAPIACWTFKQADADAAVVNTPKVVGRSFAAAQQELEEAQLNLMNSIKQSDRDASSCFVLEQYPRPGQAVLAGTSVYLRLEERSASNEAASQAKDQSSTPGLGQADSSVLVTSTTPDRAGPSTSGDLRTRFGLPVAASLGVLAALVVGVVVIRRRRLVARHDGS